MASVTELRDMARTLGLWNVAGGRIDITDETVSNLDYLYNIFSKEIEMRRAKKTDTLRRDSHLPDKTFDMSKITKGLFWQLQKLERFDFKNEIQNMLIVGPCASGKTSLSCEVGGYAIATGARVRYTTLEDMLLAIRNQNAKWKKILKADLVIIDDVFYLTPTEEELVTLYKAINFLGESRSLMLVTNRPLSEWSKMGVDKHLVETLRKRFMANAQLMHLK